MLNAIIANQISALGGLMPRGTAFSPLGDQEISEIESAFGSSLPTDYRSFVSEYGDGTFINLIRCDVTSTRLVYLGVFYGSGADENSPSHFKWAMKMLCYRMPSMLMPIADTAGGEGQICIGMSGDESGKVYYWDRAEGWEGEADDFRKQGKTYPEHLKFQNVTLLADTFERFILSLVAEEE